MDDCSAYGVGPLVVMSLARSKSHLILLPEAWDLQDFEIAYLGDLAVMARSSDFCESYIKQIAGSTFKSRIHNRSLEGHSFVKAPLRLQ